MISAHRNFSTCTEMEKAWKQLAYSRPKPTVRGQRLEPQHNSRAEQMKLGLLYWPLTISRNVLWQIVQKTLTNRSQPTEHREWKWSSSSPHQGEKFLHKSISCLTHLWFQQMLQSDNRIKQEVHQANLPNISSLPLVLQWSKDASSQKAQKENKEWS